MPYTQKAIDAMHERVLDCLTTEFPDIPANSDGADAEAGFRAAVAEIEQQSVAQSGFSGVAEQGTAQRAVARRNVRDYLDILGRTARKLSRTNPGLNRNFPMSYTLRSDDDLLTAMAAVVPKAIEYQALFLRRGIEQEFIDSGDERIAAFEASRTKTNSALSERGAAVGDKDEAYEQADEFLDTLDDFIRNRYRNQPGKIAAWKIATHIERSPSKKEAKNPSPEE